MAVRHSTQSPRDVLDSITSDLGGVLGSAIGNGLGNITGGLVNSILGSGTTPSISSTATGVSISQSNITIKPTTQGYITSYTVAKTDVYTSHRLCI